MLRIAILAGCIVIPSTLALAQPPPRAPLTRPLYSEIMDETAALHPLQTTGPLSKSDDPKPDPPIAFDTGTLRLKCESGQWQLWSVNVLLKDFGKSESDARAALQLFRDLHLNSRGLIGGAFEYYLADGAAPSAALRNKQVVPFDLATLRVEMMNGQWVLRDVRMILYNFGGSKIEARTALAVCRQYGFNQIGVVGHPIPTFKYLLRDPNPPMAMNNQSPIVLASAKMQGNELAQRQLFVPGVGGVGRLMPIDSRRLETRRELDEWCLFDGKSLLGRFGRHEYEARATLETMQQFRCNELCRIGAGGFGFFLTNGHPPTGSLIGLPVKSFKLDRLNVRLASGAWSVCEDMRPLFTFADDESAARQALAAIKHFQFDTLSPVGGGHLGDVYLLAKTR